MWINSFGLGIVQGWLWLFFLNGPLLYGLTAKFQSSPETAFITFLVFNSASYLLIIKIGRSVSEFTKKPLVIILSALFMIIGTLVTAAAIKGFDDLNYNLLISLGAMMAGCGSAMLISAWGVWYSTVTAPRASLTFGISVTIGTIIFFVINKLPFPTAVAVTAFIPFISMILLLSKVSYATEHHQTISMHQFDSCPFPIRPILLIILFYLAAGLMHKMIASGQQLDFYENFWLTNIVYFAVCLSAGLIFYLNPSFDFGLLYRLILPLLGIGFILFPSLHSTYPVIPFTFLQSGFALFDLYTWILFAYLAARHRFPVSVIAGGMFLITSTIITAEILFSKIFSSIAVSMKEPELISLLAALLMFIGTIFFRDKRETFAVRDYPSAPVEVNLIELNQSNQKPDESTCSCSNQTINYVKFLQAVLPQESSPQIVTELSTQEDMPIEQFAMQYSLTPREKQILVLLLDGRNNPYIRENLNISNNTLKTHLRNTFRKLSINDRQELLDLYIKYIDSLQ